MTSYKITDDYIKPDNDADREYLVLSIAFDDDTQETITINHEPFTSDSDRQAFATDYVKQYVADKAKPAALTNEGSAAVSSPLLNQDIEI